MKKLLNRVRIVVDALIVLAIIVVVAMLTMGFMEAAHMGARVLAP